MPRAFVQSDQPTLQKLTKQQLYVLVQAQREKWPPKKSFSISRLKKAELVAELLKPENGFTTGWPVRTQQTAAPPPIPTAPIPITVTPSAIGPTTSTISMHTPSDPTSPTISTQLHETHIKRPIKVYIHDERSNTTSKTVQKIEVTIVDRVGCSLGEWRANAMEIYQQIQVSNAAITGRGAIKIGIPDEHDFNFTHFFLRGEINFLSWAKPDPDRLKISNDSKLVLRVARYWQDEATATPSRSLSKKSSSTKSSSTRKSSSQALSLQTPPSKALARPYIEVSSDDDAIMSSPSKQIRFDYAQLVETPSQFARERRRQYHEQDILWLTSVLKERPGFNDFIRNHNRRLDNADVVSHWAFASGVADDFHLEPSGAPGSSTARLVTKAVIQEVLGVGETTLAQAIEATKILQIYGEHGTHPAAAVIAAVNAKLPPSEHESFEANMKQTRSVDATAIGSVGLLKFLRHWKASNPIQALLVAGTSHSETV